MTFAKFLPGLLVASGIALAQQYVITTVAGTPNVQGYHGDGSAALGSQLTRPFGVSADSKGNVYIPDIYTHTVRKVNASDGNISTIAGSGNYGFAGDNNSALEASLTDPRGVAADANGNVYIADTSNNRIRKVDSKGIITTFAGNGTRGYGGDGAEATKAALWFPAGMVIDGSGNLYVADYGSSTVRKITSGGAISTLAGTGTWGYSGDGGPANRAALANPVSVAVDAAGNVYIGDTGNNTIRRVGTDGNIRTILSNISPQGLAADSTGVYFVDPTSNVVRKVLPAGTLITVAGSGIPGFSGENVPALTAQMNFPSGLAAGANGTVYVADTNNQILRLLTPVPFSAGAVTNAASSVQGAIAPGEIVTLYGAGIGPATLTQFTVANGAVPNQLAGVSVTFSGIAAPLIYVSSGQVAAIAPYGIAGAPSTDIAVRYQGNTSVTTTVPVTATAPGVFTADTTGSGQASAVNENGTVNSAGNPAARGSVVSIYMTGEGQTTPAGSDGKIAGSAPLPQPVARVIATIGGAPATVLYAGAAPTLVAGVMQVNVLIPANAGTGNQPLSIQVGNASTQSGVTIAIAQ